MEIKLNLQLFAGDEKTEKPTYKKRRDAREEGQIVQSKELSTVAILFSCFLGLKLFGGFITKNMADVMAKTFGNLNGFEEFMNPNNNMHNTINIFAIFVLTILPVLLVAFVSSLLVSYAQVGFLFTTKPLKWKLDKLNPIEGFKRIFSKKGLVELVKSVLKIVLVGSIAISYAKSQITRIVKYPDMSSLGFYSNFASLIYEFVLRILGVLLLISVLDYFYQWRSHEKNLMMTKQEIKEEFKQAEGDPHIKGKIKQKQREMAMSRMMQEVPTADVIITNPTHFAVAIKYDVNASDAPIVVAKGMDLIAQKIKSIGTENEIPLVENKPLARTLYANVDIGHPISEDLYEAVAEVLAYVYSLRDKH